MDLGTEGKSSGAMDEGRDGSPAINGSKLSAAPGAAPSGPATLTRLLLVMTPDSGSLNWRVYLSRIAVEGEAPQACGQRCNLILIELTVDGGIP
jgi:hypothetical protein